MGCANSIGKVGLHLHRSTYSVLQEDRFCPQRFNFVLIYALTMHGLKSNLSKCFNLIQTT